VASLVHQHLDVRSTRQEIAALVMKWLIALVIAAAGAACSSSSTSTTGPTPVKCQVALSTPSALDANGGTGTVTITSQPECAWTASTQSSWLADLSPSSGQGNGQISFRAAANPQTSAREGEIVVNDARARVTQEASPCRYELNPGSRDVSSGVGSGSFEVVAQPGCTWTATSTAPWTSITGNATGSGNGVVSYSVQANTGSPRTGRITVADQAFVINQGSGAVTCTYGLSSSNVSVPAGGGSGSVNVAADSGCSWTATSNAPWITVTGGASGSGNGAVSFTMTANTAAARSGTISIAGHTFTVNQAAVVSLPTLSIGNAAVAEGNSGPTSLTFTVTLSAPGTSPVTVAYATADGSATAPLDYTATSGTLTFSGTTTQSITVSIVGDTVVEPNETFQVVLSAPTGATIAAGSATGTITNDDMASVPTLSIGNAALAEGNSGSTSLTFTVTLSAASASPVTVAYATADGSATAPLDYTATSGTLTFSGTTTQTITVSIVGDTAVEPNETFQVVLSAPTGATIAAGSATGTITNDDMASLPTLSIGNAALAEGNSGSTSLTFTVTLSAASASPVTVAYATADGSATAPLDYTATSGTLTFSGTTTQTITVSIVGDTAVESDETFQVVLSAPTGATIAAGSATGTITNDD
jgi:chitinase